MQYGALTPLETGSDEAACLLRSPCLHRHRHRQGSVFTYVKVSAARSCVGGIASAMFPQCLPPAHQREVMQPTSAAQAAVVGKVRPVRLSDVCSNSSKHFTARGSVPTMDHRPRHREHDGRLDPYRTDRTPPFGLASARRGVLLRPIW